MAYGPILQRLSNTAKLTIVSDARVVDASSCREIPYAGYIATAAERPLKASLGFRDIAHKANRVEEVGFA